MAKQTIGLGSSANDGTGDTARAAGQKINQNFDELYDAINVERQTSAGEFNYKLGTETSAEIDATVYGAWMFEGSVSYPNFIGASGKPISEPVTGSRTSDTYVSGSANFSVIGGGYDNYNNALAGVLISQHSMLYTGADHATILGGSLHTILDDTDYSVILGGTSCTIEGRGKYAGIYNSNSSKVETGATDAESGFRSTILGSDTCTASGRNAFITGSVSATVASTYGAVICGETITLTNGSHMLAGGSIITMGASSAATYSFAWGTDLTVNATRSLIFGDGHSVAAGSDYNVTTGYRCSPPFAGARVHSARQRGGTVGNNMALDWSASQETTDTTATRLSVTGSSSYPTQPASSIVNGTVWVTGVSDAGACSSYRIDFTSERVGTGTPTLRANSTTALYNGLSIVTAPTMNVTSGGVYRVQVVGLAGTNIRWDARFSGQQIVYG